MPRILFALVLALPTCALAQLDMIVDPSASLLFSNLGGPGVGIQSAEIDCQPGRTALFTGESSFGVSHGLLLCTATVNQVAGPNDDNFTLNGTPFTTGPIVEGQADLEELYRNTNNTQNALLHDACALVLEVFSFTDTLLFDFAFASKEYQQFECFGNYNDPFAVFVSGPGLSGPYSNGAVNVALVPGSDSIPICMNSVNAGMIESNAHSIGHPLGPYGECLSVDPNFDANAQYYVYNGLGDPTEVPYGTDPYYVQFNGVTTVFTAGVGVQPLTLYRVVVNVANANDWLFGSGVILPAFRFPYSDPSAGAAEQVDTGLRAHLSGDLLVVDLPGGAGATATLLDMRGRTLDTFRLSGAHTMWAMPSMASGVYLLQVQTSAGAFTQRVFKP
jgi:hypothetical protein